MWQTVRRTNRIAITHTFQARTDVAAVNPDTAADYTIAHVDDDVVGGDGSFETPFQTLADAAPGAWDIIFVNDGTYNADSLTLDANQRLLGPSWTHYFSTTVGTFRLPGLVSGQTANITNSPADAITVASGSEVSGLRITNPTDSGIYIDGVTDFTVNRNVITGAGMYGIEMLNSGTGFIHRNVVSNNTMEGIYINGAGNFTIRVLVNRMSGNNGGGREFLAQNTAGGTLGLRLQRNISNNNTAINYDLQNLGMGTFILQSEDNIGRIGTSAGTAPTSGSVP